MSDDKSLSTYKELTEGLHKTALAVQRVAVTQEAHAARLADVEGSLNKGPQSIQTEVQLLRARVDALEKSRETEAGRQHANTAAKIQSKGTVQAAVIAAVASILAAVIALIAVFTR